MSYSIITKNGQLFAVVSGNPYDLTLTSEYSIHEMEDAYPDLNVVSWDDATGSWIENPSKLTKLKFLNRFTMQERIAIRSSTDPIVNDIMNLFDAAEYISISDINTIQGIGYLSMAGILSTNRVAEILT